MNHWKRSFTLTCLWAVLTAGSLAAAQEPRMAAAAQMAMGNAYARGDGFERNPQLAQEWYDKARISPAMTYTLDTSSSPKWPQQAPDRRTRPYGLRTGPRPPWRQNEKCPGNHPPGQRVSYTYEASRYLSSFQRTDNHSQLTDSPAEFFRRRIGIGQAQRLGVAAGIDIAGIDENASRYGFAEEQFHGRKSLSSTVSSNQSSSTR